MLVELAVATGLVALTVIVHGWGIAGIQWAIRHMPRSPAFERHPARQVTLRVLIALSLFSLHGVEIWLYAMFFWLVGGIVTIPDAVYFSTITYGAIGYSDALLLLKDWRLVAAIEGINGILLIGWSTAFFVTIIGNLRRHAE